MLIMVLAITNYEDIIIIVILRIAHSLIDFEHILTNKTVFIHSGITVCVEFASQPPIFQLRYFKPHFLFNLHSHAKRHFNPEI